MEVLVPEPVCNCARNIYDCANFDNHEEAQACFKYCQEPSMEISMGQIADD